MNLANQGQIAELKPFKVKPPVNKHLKNNLLLQNKRFTNYYGTCTSWKYVLILWYFSVINSKSNRASSSSSAIPPKVRLVDPHGQLHIGSAILLELDLLYGFVHTKTMNWRRYGKLNIVTCFLVCFAHMITRAFSTPLEFNFSIIIIWGASQCQYLFHQNSLN